MKRRLSMLALLFVFSFAVFSATSADELPEKSFAKFMPANMLFFLETQDLAKSSERFKELSIYKMFQDPQIKEFFNALKALAPGNKMAEAEENLEMVKKMLERAAELFKGHAFIGIPPINAENFEFGFYAGVELTEGRLDDSKKFIEDLVQLIKTKANAEELQFVAEEHDGVAINSIKINEDERVPQFCYALVNDSLVFGLGMGAIKKLVDALKNPPAESLYTSPDFVKTYKMSRCSEMFWIADYQNYFETIQKMMAMMPPTPFDTTLLIDKIKKTMSKIAGGTSFVGEDIEEDVVLLIPSADEFRTMKTQMGKTCSFASAKLMPKDAILFGAGIFPAEALYDDIYEFLPDEIKDYIAIIQQQFMVDIRNEIIAALGEEFGMYLDMKSIMPDFMLAMAVKDKEAIINALQILIGNFQLPVNEVQYKEQTLYMINLPGLAIGYTFYSDFLILGSMNAVKSAIGRQANTIKDNPLFAEMMQLGGGKVVSGGFMDLRRGFEIAYSQGMPFLQMYLANNPEFDPTIIPTADVFSQYIRPVVMSSYMADNVAYTKVKGVMPIGTLCGMSMMIGTLSLQFAMTMGGGIFGDVPGGEIF